VSEPVVFISRNRIKQGKADEFRKHYRDSVPVTNATKPGTLAQLAYENDQATEVTIVRLFPSADALDQQIQGADERSKKTYEFIEPISIEIFGAPSPATLEKMKKIAGSGVAVSISPHYIDGFIRQLETYRRNQGGNDGFAI
jgi:quinol monooxygenase YgiN